MALGYNTPQPPRISMHIRLGDKQNDAQSHQRGAAGTPKHYLEQADLLVARIRAAECTATAVCPPVGVYIATDGPAAVTAARQWAATRAGSVRLIVASTLSQNASAGGAEIVKELQTSLKSEAYTIAEEVVLDVNLLLGTQYFVGLCMSQLARYVVSVGFAQGTLQEAIAMDGRQKDRKDQFKLGTQHVGWRLPLVNSASNLEGP